MRGWARRTWRRAREESPRRALRASAHEAAAGTVGRLASDVYGQLSEPTPIWERDWDVLCLLDGCRVDLFREVADDGDYEFLPGPSDVDTIWSVGSQSAEWMARTFDDPYREQMQRTAYLTGNPFSAQTGNQIAAVETEPLPLADEDFGLLYEAWRSEWVDEDISTIPPAPLTDATIATWRGRADLEVDRVIVHYMQPHCPFRSQPDWFLGSAPVEEWGKLEEDEDDEGDEVDGGDASEDGLGTLEELDEETRELLEALDEGGEIGRDPWTRLRDGELPAEEFWAAYRDNLRWVLDDVARLVQNCEGRVAITSDHGNAAGEFGVWSHPPAVELPALREVPWVTVEGTDRDTHDPDLPAEALARTRPAAVEGETVEAAAERRLVDLGYR